MLRGLALAAGSAIAVAACASTGDAPELADAGLHAAMDAGLDASLDATARPDSAGSVGPMKDSGVREASTDAADARDVSVGKDGSAGTDAARDAADAADANFPPADAALESGTDARPSDAGPCVPTTSCEPSTCGDVDDGCGVTLRCCGDGSSPCGICWNQFACVGQLTCGGGGVSFECGCANPITCAGVGVECGPLADSCGDILDCGSCQAPASCGGGGIAGVCGCTPLTCASEGGPYCGSLPDGCGGMIQCGTCSGGGACNNNRCGTCIPQTCLDLGACGTTSDGCGGILSCASQLVRAPSDDTGCPDAVHSKAYVCHYSVGPSCLGGALPPPPGWNCVAPEDAGLTASICCE